MYEKGALQTGVFNGVFYSQIEGLGIGSPLSPLLCDIYMHYFEEKTLQCK